LLEVGAKVIYTLNLPDYSVGYTRTRIISVVISLRGSSYYNVGQ